MNKELVKKYKLEETVKRLNQICEYTFITSPTLSEDDDEIQDDDVSNNTEGDELEQSNDKSMGQEKDGVENDELSDDNFGDDDVEMNQNQDDNMEDDLSFETEEMQDGDEVVDIDDLTQSQEATEYKVDDTNRKLTQILKVVSNFSDALDANSRGLEDLKREFEKRNPTEEERLNLRSQASYPYSEQPKDYWDKKVSQNPNYNVMYDNDVSTSDEQKKFEIRKSDIDNVNFNEIGKTFRLDDFLNF